MKNIWIISIFLIAILLVFFSFYKFNNFLDESHENSGDSSIGASGDNINKNSGDSFIDNSGDEIGSLGDNLNDYFIDNFDYKTFIKEYYLLDMIYQKTGIYLTNEELEEEYRNTFFVYSLNEKAFLICNKTLGYEKTTEGYKSSYYIMLDDIAEYLK